MKNKKSYPRFLNLSAISLHRRATSRSRGFEQLASITRCDLSSSAMIVFRSVFPNMPPLIHGTSILSKSMPRSFIKLPSAMMFSRVVVTLKARVSNSGCAGCDS